jgi:hypothetical protein
MLIIVNFSRLLPSADGQLASIPMPFASANEYETVHTEFITPSSATL